MFRFSNVVLHRLTSVLEWFNAISSPLRQRFFYFLRSVLLTFFLPVDSNYSWWVLYWSRIAVRKLFLDVSRRWVGFLPCSEWQRSFSCLCRPKCDAISLPSSGVAVIERTYVSLFGVYIRQPDIVPHVLFEAISTFSPIFLRKQHI